MFVGRVKPMFVYSLNRFLKPIDVCFLKGVFLILGGWWKAFKPFHFKHQTSCPKICSRSENWKAERERLRQWEHTARCQVCDLKLLLRAELEEQKQWIRPILKCHGSSEKEIKFDSERTTLTWPINNSSSFGFNELFNYRVVPWEGGLWCCGVVMFSPWLPCAIILRRLRHEWAGEITINLVPTSPLNNGHALGMGFTS